jgi:hypothetical protein
MILLTATRALAALVLATVVVLTGCGSFDDTPRDDQARCKALQSGDYPEESHAEYAAACARLAEASYRTEYAAFRATWPVGACYFWWSPWDCPTGLHPILIPYSVANRYAALPLNDRWPVRGSRTEHIQRMWNRYPASRSTPPMQAWADGASPWSRPEARRSFTQRVASGTWKPSYRPPAGSAAGSTFSKVTRTLRDPGSSFKSTTSSFGGSTSKSWSSSFKSSSSTSSFSSPRR